MSNMTGDASFSGPALAAERQRRLRALVDAHCEPLGRLLRSLGVREADVDDAVQEVFIVASRRIDDVVRGSERAFLYRTAMNVAAHARRTIARRRESASEDVEPFENAPSPEELADRARARACLDRILDAMPIELRTVFVLFEIHELPTPEIAELLELPTGTAASRLRRARADFEQRVKRWEARKGERP